MKVQVNASKIVETLKKNRAEHKEIYDEAVLGYYKEAKKHFKEQLDLISKGQAFERSFYKTAPTHHLKDYDRAIKMLENSQESSVTLDEEDFARYMENDWEWRGNFLASNSVYSSKASFLAASLTDDD